MACKTVALRPALDRRPFNNEQAATRERAALAKRSEALPALRGRLDESQTCLGILGFAQMRRALRDNHFQRRPHMGCAEVPGHGAAIASAKNDMDMERGLAFEPDRPSYGIRLSDKTSGLRTRETMSKGSQLHECGLSATSPISEATSTCSCTGILSYVFVSN